MMSSEFDNRPARPVVGVDYALAGVAEGVFRATAPVGQRALIKYQRIKDQEFGASMPGSKAQWA